MTNQPNIIALRKYLENTIVGQADLLDKLVVSLLTGGHILVEGLPGLAKTTAHVVIPVGLCDRLLGCLVGHFAVSGNTQALVVGIDADFPGC